MISHWSSEQITQIVTDQCVAVQIQQPVHFRFDIFREKQPQICGLTAPVRTHAAVFQTLYDLSAVHKFQVAVRTVCFHCFFQA